MVSLVSPAMVGVPTALVPGLTFLMVGQIVMDRSRGDAMVAVLGIMTSRILWS
ncbi:MAG: hypothetical protein KGJ78_01135 [Alphaproteobacteria bacterium]|nr:hypothetical protein [Alphaproteobacteria bacterium]